MGHKIELSKRLGTVAGLVSQGNRVCDVGCDHGYVPLYLVQNNISPWVLAMDIHKGPLERAQSHVCQYDMEGYIELRLSDGLSDYRKKEADTLICAGMGGRLIIQILDKEMDKTEDFKELILQPQSEISSVRRFLREKRFAVTAEEMVFEDGKFYPIMKVSGRTGIQENKSIQDLEREDRFGALLLNNQNEVLLAYIKQEWKIYSKIREGLLEREEPLTDDTKEADRKKHKRRSERLMQVEAELAVLQKAAVNLDLYQIEKGEI